MKKFISVFLSVLMLFSIATVAFAADDETTTEPTTETTTVASSENDNPLIGMDEDEIMDMLANMDWWEMKAIFKIAKIAVKLALVLDKLGFIDLSPIKNAILDMVWGLIKDAVEKDDAETTTAATTEALIVATTDI